MWKTFTSDLRRNITKLLCLTIGTGIGLLLIAAIYFENTYDTSYDDWDRIYLLTESIEQNGEYLEYNKTPGGTAPLMKKYVPQIEEATRMTGLLGECNIRFDDGTKIRVDGISLADNNFFDVLRTEIISGDPHEVLDVLNMCMVPRSLAEKAGRDVVGAQISCPDYIMDYKATIGGVYEDFPENSSIRNSVYLSLATIAEFTYDGRENLSGNDRYIGYAKLIPGANAEDTKPAIDKMLAENYDPELISVYHFGHGMRPLSEFHSSQDNVKSRIWLLSILAFAMLLISSVNYLLIVVGQISTRSKEMAIRKCFGTDNRKIFRLTLKESFIYLIAAMGLGILIVFCFSDTCRDIMGVGPEVLFSTGHVWIAEAAIFILLLILTGVVPAIIYCRTPVANAFRVNAKSRKAWKLIMLSIEFAATGFLLCLVVLIGRQYHLVTNLDMGFKYENVAIIYTTGMDGNKSREIAQQISKLGCVENVAFSFQNYTEWAYGNNVWLEGKKVNQVNVADMYYASPEIFETLGMEFVQGGPFGEPTDSTSNLVVVEERFVDMLQRYFDVTDSNVIGQAFYMTGHENVAQGEFVICGVIKNMRRGGFENDKIDRRPGVILSSNYSLPILYVKLTEMNPDNLSQIQNILRENITDKEVYATPYKQEVALLASDIKRTGKSVTVVGFAILFIALLGLIGYTSDEVNRRAKEIAIRKVTGTAEWKIVKLFCIDVLKIAVPSLLAGGIIAYIFGQEWLSRFTDQVDLSPMTFVACLLAIAILITLIVVLNSLSVARSNPVNHLRNE